MTQWEANRVKHYKLLYFYPLLHSKIKKGIFSTILIFTKTG